MIRIGVKFRKSRAKQSQKQGTVVFQIINGHFTDDSFKEVAVTTDIKGDNADVLQDKKEQIISRLKQLYCLLEVMNENGVEYDVDDIANKFKELIFEKEPDNIVSAAIAKANTDFLWQNRLAYLPKSFRKYFRTDDDALTLRMRRKNDDVGNTSEITDLTSFIKSLIYKFRNSGKDTRARNYAGCLGYLEEFAEGKAIPFELLNKSFISDYGNFLKTNSTLQKSTQSLYMRCLRTILSQAQDDGFVTFDRNWFKGTNRKIIYEKDEPLTYDEAHGLLMRIMHTNFGDQPELEEMRDIFMLAFYCRGMENFDVMSLTTENIKDGYIEYKKRGIGREYIVTLEENAKDIIKKYKSSIPNGDNRLFPIAREYASYQKTSFRNIVTRRMQAIGEKVGCPELRFGYNKTLWRILFNKSAISSALIS